MPPPSNTEPSAPSSEPGTAAGRVVFVGAGPGDPDLLTVRGVQVLREADVIVHDALVPVAVLDSAGRGAELVPVPRAPAGDDDPGVAVGRLLVDLARRHRLVVRLKGGDPAVFARLAEEQQPLREAGIAWQIVPGVTAAVAAAAAAGVPLTSRAAASSVTFLTGHEACAKESPLDFEALARLPGTLVVYMGVEQVATWSRHLIAAGRRGDTPVTVVSRCSWPDQRIQATTLAGCGREFEGCAWPAPAIVIVGDVAGRQPAPGGRGDLAGRTILLTRPAGQGADVAALVSAHGGIPVQVPVIRIEPPESWRPLDAALDAADTFDWIVFASVNGVRGFRARMAALGRDPRHLGTARIAAIGPATAREVAALGLECDLVPAEQRSEGIVAALGHAARRGRFLLVRADRGRDVMRRGLEALGHEVVEVAAYSSRGVAALDPATLADLDAAPVDWVTITSSFVAESALRLFGDRLRRWRVVSASPVITAALEAAGVRPAAEARQPTSAGLVEAITAWEAAHRCLAQAAESSTRAPSLPLPPAGTVQPPAGRRR